MKRFVLFSLTCLLMGCTDGANPSSEKNPNVLRVAVTTSTQDSGLLDELIPLFEREAGVRVDVIAVGTGAALKLGETDDVDVVLVHARDAEDRFLAKGYGSRREDVMYNTFEILGPPSDPAGIRSTQALEAVRKIAENRSVFVSRGDDSGTHKKEQSLWSSAGMTPDWDEYLETGQGMGATLTIADQKRAYVLCDRGTWLRYKSNIELIPLVDTSSEMNNPYGVLVVSQPASREPKMQLANRFVDFIIGPEAQTLIRDFQIEGDSLFTPMRLNLEVEDDNADAG